MCKFVYTMAGIILAIHFTDSSLWIYIRKPQTDQKLEKLTITPV